MNFEQLPSSKEVSNEKDLSNIQDKIDQVVRQKRLALEGEGDALGRGIDLEIIDAVAAFNLAGFPTQASCQGHCGEENGLAAPWVEIANENEPLERFNQQEAVFQEVAKKYNCSVEEVKRSDIDEAYHEAMLKMANNGETDDYISWEKSNQELFQKMEELIKEFNEKYKLSNELKIRVERFYCGFRVYSGGEDYKRMSSEIAKEDQAVFREQLALYQKEIKNFSRFLVEKKIKR